jgi:soluble lytic murein transglycosylase-like protein
LDCGGYSGLCGANILAGQLYVAHALLLKAIGIIIKKKHQHIAVWHDTCSIRGIEDYKMRVGFRDDVSEMLGRLNARPGVKTEEPRAATFDLVLGDLVSSGRSHVFSLEKALQATVEEGTPLARQGAIPLFTENIPEPQPLPPTPIYEQEPNLPRVNAPTLLEVKRIRVPNPVLVSEETKEQVQALIHAAGRKHAVDPALSMAVAQAESGFNPLAISQDGHASKGVFQLLDSTGTHLLEKTQLTETKAREYNPYDPALNTELGVSYLRYLHDLFSRATDLSNGSRSVKAADLPSLEKLAVAAFNAGEGRVVAAQERASRAGKDPAQFEQVEPYLPETTQTYVARVSQFRDRFATEDSTEG